MEGCDLLLTLRAERGIPATEKKAAKGGIAAKLSCLLCSSTTAPRALALRLRRLPRGVVAYLGETGGCQISKYFTGEGNAIYWNSARRPL
jgi:hypothetical protein